MEFTEDYLVPLWEKLAQEKKGTTLVGNFITFWIRIQIETYQFSFTQYAHILFIQQ